MLIRKKNWLHVFKRTLVNCLFPPTYSSNASRVMLLNCRKIENLIVCSSGTDPPSPFHRSLTHQLLISSLVLNQHSYFTSFCLQGGQTPRVHQSVKPAPFRHSRQPLLFLWKRIDLCHRLTDSSPSPYVARSRTPFSSIVDFIWISGETVIEETIKDELCHTVHGCRFPRKHHCLSTVFSTHTPSY